ncbi:fimbrial protein [Providencia manganoxydans]|uniref:fimbrial protein n=1 Tax=Providencia manganoxydans TaxID=2923283 RepID=UPI0032DA2BD7
MGKLLNIFVVFLYTFIPCLTFAGNQHFTIIDGGTVHLRGALVAPACTVASGSRSLTVEMGQLRSNQFGESGSDALPVPFSLRLTDCEPITSQNVGISFWGQVDTQNPHVLKVTEGINAAKGVGVALFTEDGQPIIINSHTPTTFPLQKGDNILKFVAKYRATAQQITSGNAEAATWFSVTYP